VILRELEVQSITGTSLSIFYPIWSEPHRIPNSPLALLKGPWIEVIRVRVRVRDRDRVRVRLLRETSNRTRLKGIAWNAALMDSMSASDISPFSMELRTPPVAPMNRIEGFHEFPVVG